MKNIMIYFVLGLIIVFYGALNYYIGLRGWQSLGHQMMNSKFYWPAFWLIALSYFLGRLGGKFLPLGVSRGLTIVGAYWLAAMFYLLMILAVIDVVRLLDKWLGFLPGWIKNSPAGVAAAGLVVLALVSVILIYGTWNARHPQVTHYDLTIPKPAGTFKQLHVVMVSDIHLGNIIHNGRLDKMVDMINNRKPDLVLLGGDIFDENIKPAEERELTAILGRIHAGLGVFAVMGNHEYISGYPEDAVRYLQAAGIEVLRDRWVEVAGSFYVLGRDDGHMNRSSRKPLAEVMAGIDRSRPVILLDHEPPRRGDAERPGVDLQLSGHTHRGQLFPNHLITRRMYEIDWGYLRQGSLQVIVSSGIGTWGPPIRTGNKPEVVDISIRFSE